MTHEADQSETIPQATVQPRRGGRWVWLIPAAAMIFVGVLMAIYVVKRGDVITVTLNNGHNIKPGDALRCRGITVGQVERVRLTDDLGGVIATVRLEPDAGDIARSGSRFWVERPRVSLTGIAGLETIAGPRYLAVLPGEGDRRSAFIGLDDPPALESPDPSGLEILLQADQRHGLTAGAPILYRGVPIGIVLGAGLASDSASIEVRAYIHGAYAPLVRDNTKFWNVSGARIDAGLTGVSVKLQSLAAMITGGIAMATPNTPGKRVATGHRFTLAEKADDDWLTWRPALAVGVDLLPPGAPRPDMLRATRREIAAGFFGGDKLKRGWLLPISGGVIGPADLLAAPPAGINTDLEVAGKRFTLKTDAPKTAGGLGRAAIDVPDAVAWPADRVRRMTQREDCVVMTDPSLRVVPVAAARLIADGDHWRVDPIISFDESMNGAAVLSRRDGQLVGLLLVQRGAGVIAPIP